MNARHPDPKLFWRRLDALRDVHCGGVAMYLEGANAANQTHEALVELLHPEQTRFSMPLSARCLDVLRALLADMEGS